MRQRESGRKWEKTVRYGRDPGLVGRGRSSGGWDCDLRPCMLGCVHGCFCLSFRIFTPLIILIFNGHHCCHFKVTGQLCLVSLSKVT